MDEQEYKKVSEKILERDREIFRALAGIDYDIVELPAEKMDMAMPPGSYVIGSDPEAGKVYVLVED